MNKVELLESANLIYNSYALGTVCVPSVKSYYKSILKILPVSGLATAFKDI
jgi:hypothetical protein